MTSQSNLSVSLVYKDFHQEIINAANANHRKHSLGSITNRLLFIINAYRHWAVVYAFIKRVTQLSNGARITITPQMLGVIEWPYLHNQWDVKTRFDKIATHYEVLSKLKSNLIYMSSTSSFELINLGRTSANVSIVLDRASWFIREGEMLINVFRKGLRIASIAFTLGEKDGVTVAYIGAIQGVHSGVATEDSLALFKLLTKDFQGLRPRSLLLEVLKVVLKKLGVSRLYAVSEQNRHHRHHYFRNNEKTVFVNDYNPIWEENGGILDENTGFYEIPIGPAIKSIEDIPSKKRSQYKRRYEFILSLGDQINLENLPIFKPGTEAVSAINPDWSREHKPFFAWDPSRALLESIRSYQSLAQSNNPIKVFLKKIVVLKHLFWSIVTGADIPLNVKIGGGLLLPHPNGVVIHAAAEIGVNCVIFQQVTIGTRGDSNAPIIGGHVDIGSGARLIGNIRVGNHAKIGANAVVLTDVPAGKTAVGIPARIV